MVPWPDNEDEEVDVSGMSKLGLVALLHPGPRLSPTLLATAVDTLQVEGFTWLAESSRL